MEEDRRRRPPRAVNIIRPSSPLFDAIRRQQQQQSTAGSMTSSSTWSSSSASSILSTEFPATAVGFIQTRPGSPFGSFRPASPSGWSFMGGKQASPLGPLSRMVTAAANAASTTMAPPPTTVTTTTITRKTVGVVDMDAEDDDDDDDDEEEEDDDEDMYSEEDDDDDDENFSSDEAPEVVARMKQGCTIMNGKGELVVVKKSPASTTTATAVPSDHARLGRKIADLEIENTSLASVNMELEQKIQAQAVRIAELEKQTQERYGDIELPPTPVSMSFSESDEETETELVYERIKSMLQALIEEAQWAVAAHNNSKMASGGRVLTDRQRLMMEQYDRASMLVRTPPPTPPPYANNGGHRTRSRSGSKNYSVVSCPPEIVTSPTPMSDRRNRRSWPMAATPGSSRLLRMATQPGSNSSSPRQRSQSMVRVTSSP